MRITKVKVGKEDVVMQRDGEEGYLRVGEKPIKSEEIIEQFIQNNKIGSIKQSLTNTLLREYPEKKETLCKKALNKSKSLEQVQATYEVLINIIEQLIGKPEQTNLLIKPVDVDFDLLACCFKPKFYDATNYQQLLDAFAFNNDSECFTLLKKSWLAEWINNKLNKYQYTARSIENNRIEYRLTDIKDPYDEEIPKISKRKQFLNKLIHELIDEACDAAKELEKKLAEIAKRYELSQLLQQLSALPRTQNEKNEEKAVNNLYREYKSYLQKTHQPKIFGTSLNPLNRDDIELYVYHNEFVAYLEYYFPIYEKIKNTEDLDNQKISLFLSEQKVKKVIFYQVLNKLRQHLLMNGKIVHQQRLEKPDGNNVDSRLLQQIKLTETLRRKLSDDVTFAANQLKNELIKPIEVDFVLISTSSDCYKNYNNWSRTPKTSEEQQSRLALITKLIEQLNPLEFIQLNEYKNFLTEHSDFLGYQGKGIGDYNTQHIKLHSTLAKFFDGIQRCNTPEFGTYENLLTCLHQLDFLHKDASIIVPILQKIHNINNSSYQSIRNLRNTVFHVMNDINQDVDIEPIKESLNRDCNGAKNRIIEGLHSNNTLRFYDQHTIGKILDVELAITYKSQPFSPSLNKVLHRAENLQKEWASNIEKREPRYYARYYLLNLLYYHNFLPVFLNNIELVHSSLERITNRLDLEKKKFKNRDDAAIAYDDFIELADDCVKAKTFTVSGFLAEIQRMAGDAISKAEKAGQEAKTHYQRFLQDLFLFGFDTFLSSKSALLKPSSSASDDYYQKNGLETAINDFAVIINIANFDFNTENKNLLHWYNLLKLLDNKRLNQLKGELLKYKQAQESLHFQDDLLKVNCDDLIKLVQLSQLYADKTVLSDDLSDAENEIEQHVLRQLLSRFVDFSHNNIETLKTFEPTNPQQGDRQQLYLSGDNIIRHKTLDKIEKYHTSFLFEKLTLSKVTIIDCESFLQQEKSIVTVNKSREELHKKWISSKGKNKSKFNDQDKIKYQKMIKEEQSFIALKNKVTLFNIEKLNNLFNDIWSHWISLAYLWERDLYYAALALLGYKSLLNEKNIISALKDDRSKVDFVYSNINENTRCFIFSLFMPNVDADNVKDIRNAIVHYRYLTKAGEKSLLSYLEDLRILMSYDRKLKNAVTKSFIDLLDKHGIEIKLKLSHVPNNKIEIDVDEKSGKPKIKSKQISHLGGAVKVDQHPQEYIDMVHALLELGEKP